MLFCLFVFNGRSFHVNESSGREILTTAQCSTSDVRCDGGCNFGAYPTIVILQSFWCILN